MGLVTINEDYLTSIADSIRLMKQTTNRITTDSMAGEIRTINIGWEPDAHWERPVNWPDYSAIDISDFEGMYFTYDTTVSNPWVGLTCTVTGGYCVERGHITDGAFVVDETTNVNSAASFLEWIPYSVYDYVVYRVTPQVATNHITRIGQVAQTAAIFDGKITNYNMQPVVERYGRLPYVTGLYQWQNVGVISDTIYDLVSLTTLAATWNTCYKIQNIQLPGFGSRVTSCAQVFRNCYELKYATTKNLVTSTCTTMSEMFSTCLNLCYIDTTGWDTSKVTSFASAFTSCWNLYELDVSNFDTSSATTMASMFYNDSKLRYLDVSGFDVSKVTTFSSTFRLCGRLESLDVSHWNTSSATTFTYMFHSCYFLRDLDVSEWSTPKLTNTTYMFTNVRNLRSIDLHNWDASKITDASYMFDNCHGVESINLSSWTCSALTKAQNMFNCCYSLEELNTTGMTVSNLFKAANCMSGTFPSMHKVRKLDLSGWDVSAIPANYASVFRYDYCVEEIIMPDSFDYIAATYFGDCRSLEKLVLPYNGVVTLANTNAFGNTPANKVIYVPDDLIDDYQAATNWKSVACEFKGISELE